MSLSAYFGSLSVANLLSRMPAAAAQGMIWGLMALGVFITFRVLDIADLTVDGSFATGGAVTVMLLLAGWPSWPALLAAFAAGVLTGLVTGLLHTKLGIPAILAGILTQFSLYSINLRIMTKANQTASIKKFGMFWEGPKGFLLSSLYVPQAIAVGFVLAVVAIALLYWYFGTEQGSAMRATGSNPAMGRGAIVIGLAAIIIGEVLCDAIFTKGCNFAIRLLFVVFGGVIYYAVMVIILWLKLDPNDLKLFTAIIVAIFLAVPHLQAQAKSSFAHLKKQGKGRG